MCPPAPTPFLSGAFPLVCVTLNGAPTSSEDRNSSTSSFRRPSSSASDASPRGASLPLPLQNQNQNSSQGGGALGLEGVGRAQTPLAPMGPVVGDGGARPDSPLDPFDRP